MRTASRRSPWTGRKTNVVKKTLHPVWDDRFEFDYSTRYPDRLGRKEVKIECFDHDFWGRDGACGFAAPIWPPRRLVFLCVHAMARR